MRRALGSLPLDLARPPLSQLVREDFIRQRRGERDQRQRLLELTDRGVSLERELFQSQRTRVARAYHNAGAEAVEGFRQVLLNLMDVSARERFGKR